MENNPKKWIQNAKLKKGAFTKQAKAAGKSVQGFSSYVLHHKDKFSSTTIKRASLAKTFKKMAK